MSAQEVSSLLNYGTTKTFYIPIDHLDYSFIEKCTDVKHLEKILRILRSGEEGHYPDLTEFCENRLASLAPESRALRKDKAAATASSFTFEEWQQIDDDIKEWLTKIKMKENNTSSENVLDFQEAVETLPPVRHSKSSMQNKSLEKKQLEKKKVPRDYKEWDKFDVEKECSRIDEDDAEKIAKAVVASTLPKIEKRIDTEGMSSKEKCFVANHEKKKGNEAFRTGDFEEAVTYYSRSISVLPTIAAYNNRAQAEIKLQNWSSAFNDCEKVLNMEPGNLKALLRRATVYKHQGNYQPAAEDLNEVLQNEHNNVVAKNMLCEVELKIKDLNMSQRKGKQILIQDVEDSDEDNINERGDTGKSKNEKKTGVPAVGAIASKKSEMGNVPKKFSAKEDCCKFEENPTQTHKNKSQSQTKSLSEKKNKRSSVQNGNETHQQINKELEQQCKKNAGDEVEQHSGSESLPHGKEASVLLPPTAAELKSEGNELFKKGQFGEAVLKYSEAIEKLKSLEGNNPEDISILYSNRAACYLKDGNYNVCIEDCSRALELQPFFLKPLLRRAIAYESIERYRQAYVDYKTALQIDGGIQAANDSINRITRTLIDQDGSTWREKLPLIPAVPISMRRWGEKYTSDDKGQNTVGNSSEDRESSWINGKKDEKLFLSLKQDGNELVKKSQYQNAIDKYNECLRLNSTDCSIYTNRALCYLKMNRFQEAKQDCDQALELEAGNIKAFYRRALAYKGLQNYQASVNDLNKVLLMDPNVAEAEKELEVIASLLNSHNGIPSNHNKPRKKIPIEEVNEDEEGETMNTSKGSLVNHLAAGETAETDRPTKSSEKLQINKPSNAYEFGQLINAVTTEQDRFACADLLSITEPKDLPVLLSNKLDGDTFMILIQSLQSCLLEKDPNLVCQHLFYLSEAERFKMVLMLLDKNEKEQIQQLFDLLSKQCDQCAIKDVKNLSQDYGL
uniref:Sperm-associated antigen 1 n=1 Tax=Geotrypetes seraphini TaxID=260995 RepID=A0A6P8QNH5_GEOSA|nr:sperm-associated antigen 1 [Geotrypetes seraphini]XP_033789027.1 sperm-associated antigen 1 [Geotrypetes seraphini]XP_033789028.1 sperm-associated antigen 1 [Geotrypetes seraphini]